MRLKKIVQILSGEAESVGRYRMPGAYRSTLHRVQKFAGDDAVSLKTVFTVDFLVRFQKCLKMDNLAMDTVSFYMNRLRSIYTAAVKAGELSPRADLFSYVFTGHAATKKRSLSAATLAKLHAADLSADPRLEYCRNLFMLCLYLQGMPFVDLVYLRKCDWQDNLLTYLRQKTDSPVSVYVLDVAKSYLLQLVDDTVNTPHLLPFVTLEGEEGYGQYKSALRLQNDRLKDLAAHLGITENLSTYAARHSWATLAHKGAIPVASISKAMGHKTEEMTQIYINSIDHEEIRTANQAVADAVMRPIQNGEVTNVREEVRLEMEKQMPKPKAKQVRRNVKPEPEVLPEPEPIVETAQVVEKPAEKPVEQQPVQQTPTCPQPEKQQKPKTPACNNFKPKAPELNPVKPQKKKHLSRSQQRKLKKKKRKEEKKRMKQKMKQKKPKIIRHPLRDGKMTLQTYRLLLNRANQQRHSEVNLML